MKNPTNFSREFIKTAIDYKVAEPEKLRDYDILKDREKNMSLQGIAIKYGMSKQGVINLLARYNK